MTDDPQVFRALKHECTDENCHVPDFIASLSDRDDIHLIHQKIDGLVDSVTAVKDVISEIETMVGPFIDQVSNIPMVKMMLAATNKKGEIE